MTAKDLYEAVLGFIVMIPDYRKWNKESLSDNERQLIRFRRIIALFKAFGIVEEEPEPNVNLPLMIFIGRGE